MVNGAVRDTASAKRIAEGLLAPAIEALERGTPPVVAGEPIAWLDDGSAFAGSHRVITNETKECMPKRLALAYSIPLYTTPQPTQAQAGAVPLTDEQIARIARSVLETPVADEVAPAWTLAVGIARAIESAHGIGIKGGQHGL